MNPAQNTNNTDDLQKKTPAVIASTAGKEQEGVKISPETAAVETSAEIEISKEVERAGVELLKDTIELPPDVKKLGVTTAGTSTPVTTTTVLPQVPLPISDQQVVAGLHAQILSSLRWLATWCVRKLKKGHIALKNIHGKIVRVKY